MRLSKKTIIIIGLVFWLASDFAQPLLPAAAQVFAYNQPTTINQPANAPETVPVQPAGLSEEEQAKLDRNQASFADYLSWLVIISGLTIFIFGILHLHRLLRG